MEDGSLFNVLFEYGAMGIFAAFLVWQHLTMQKRSDSMIEKFQRQLDKIREEQKAELQEIRGRYEKVIQDLAREREQTRQMFFDKISEVDRDTDQIIEMLKEQQQEKKLKELAKKMAGKDPNDTMC